MDTHEIHTVTKICNSLIIGLSIYTLVNVYVDLVVFMRIAGTS